LALQSSAQLTADHESLKFRLSGDISKRDATIPAKNCGLLHSRSAVAGPRGNQCHPLLVFRRQ
jgi:hypothetical protein